MDLPQHQETAPVAVLLSVYNGAAFLNDLLTSLKQQTHTNWVLLWRDDGSTDASIDYMHQFALDVGTQRCRQITSSPAHMGVVLSYATLLKDVPEGYFIAFCDQDDVWFPDKLERGLKALTVTQKPALYCSRQRLTDTRLRPISISPQLPPHPCFQMALTQNIATGCTIMLSPAAVSLLQSSFPRPTIFCMIGGLIWLLLAQMAPLSRTISPHYFTVSMIITLWGPLPYSHNGH